MTSELLVLVTFLGYKFWNLWNIFWNTFCRI